jgi:hypothetical protein
MQQQQVFVDLAGKEGLGQQQQQPAEVPLGRAPGSTSPTPPRETGMFQPPSQDVWRQLMICTHDARPQVSAMANEDTHARTDTHAKTQTLSHTHTRTHTHTHTHTHTQTHTNY